MFSRIFRHAFSSTRTRGGINSAGSDAHTYFLPPPPANPSSSASAGFTPRRTSVIAASRSSVPGGGRAMVSTLALSLSVRAMYAATQYSWCKSEASDASVWARLSLHLWAPQDSVDLLQPPPYQRLTICRKQSPR